MRRTTRTLAFLASIALGGTCFGLPDVLVTLEDRSVVRGELERFEDGVIVVQSTKGVRRLKPEQVREVRFVSSTAPVPGTVPGPSSAADSDEERAALTRLEREFLRTPPMRLVKFTQEKVRKESPERLRRLIVRLQNETLSGERRSIGMARRYLVRITLEAFLTSVEKLPKLRREVKALDGRKAFRDRYAALRREVLAVIDQRLKSGNKSGTGEPGRETPSSRGGGA